MRQTLSGLAAAAGIVAIGLLGGVDLSNRGDPWADWDLDPWVLAGVALIGWLYVCGVARAQGDSRAAIGASEYRAFAGGWCAVVIALVSPLQPLGKVLLMAHATQDNILMLIAAPLFVLGKPGIALLQALPVSWRKAAQDVSAIHAVQRVGRIISRPAITGIAYAIVLWVWHAPALFDAALENAFIHMLQRLCLLGAAILLWRSLVHSTHRAMDRRGSAIFLLTTALHSSVLGLLVTFADHAWYSGYYETTRSWGLSPMEDQQIAGIFIWAPSVALCAFAALRLMAGGMRKQEKSQPQPSPVSAA